MASLFPALQNPKQHYLGNLFSGLTEFGGKMIQAGAPTTDPSYAQRMRGQAIGGLGKALGGGQNQYRKQLLEAMQLQQTMQANKLNAEKTKLEMEALKRENENLSKLQNMFSMTPTGASVPQTDGSTVSVPVPPIQDAKVGKFGFVMTPDRTNALNLASTTNVDQIPKLFESFRKMDNDLIKDARNRLKPTINALNETIVKIDKVNRAVLLQNGTADLAAINSYQRLIDEGVVRGEDVALQAKASPLYGRLKLLAKNVKAGDLLTPELRDRMAETSNSLGRTVYDNANTQINYQKMLAQRNNVPWSRVYAGSEMYKKYLNPITPTNPQQPKKQNNVVEKYKLDLGN
tara:strand:- start:2838 stop:3875 length:1038 start_codon:yes stop_codon:yes gene_type:complete